MEQRPRSSDRVEQRRWSSDGGAATVEQQPWKSRQLRVHHGRERSSGAMAECISGPDSVTLFASERALRSLVTAARLFDHFLPNMEM